MGNSFFQATSVQDRVNDAILELSQKFAASQLDPDLVVVFAAGYEPDEIDEAFGQLREVVGTGVLIGCTAETVIGGATEFEGQAAISMWAASLPGVELTPLHLNFLQSQGESRFEGWPLETDGDWPGDSVLLIFGEPFGFPIDVLLQRFNEDRPGIRVVGGMASGAHQPGLARLFLNDRLYDQGAVAVRISGVPVRTLVSQGCRPIGEPMIITSAERNIVHSLGGRPALKVLQELFQTMPTLEQRMMQQGIHLGRVISEYQENFSYGDFLVRNVVGTEADSESLVIGDYVRVGQTVQFHLRDHGTASQELAQILEGAAVEGEASGALLMTCNGRGLNMFPDPNHDASMVQSKMPCPLAGFFAAGEIGPVGEKNFLHGFTASIVLF